MEKALAQGTADAPLLYHAGMITRRRRRSSPGQRVLCLAAWAINPATVMEDSQVAGQESIRMNRPSTVS